MAVAKRIKEQSELMEKRLKELKEAMVKEKEERQRFMEARWKSIRLLKKTTSSHLQFRENLKVVIVKEDKSKKLKRKLENCNLNKDALQVEKANLGLEITGSTLHSRITQSSSKQAVVRGQRTNSCIPVGLDSLQTESARSSINENAVLSPIFEAPSTLFDGDFDEVKNSEDFQKAVSAWRENRALPLKIKKDYADKETNPLDICFKKFDLNDLTQSYQLALLNNSKQSNKLSLNENSEVVNNNSEISATLNENKKLEISMLNENNQSNGVKLNILISTDENDESKECSMMNQVEFRNSDEIQPVCIDFENLRLAAASTGLRKTFRNQDKKFFVENIITRNPIQVLEIETAPFKPIEEGPKWISPEDNTENTEMFGRFDDTTRLSTRSNFTISPMFDNSLTSFRPMTRNKLPPLPRWSTAPAKRDLLSRSSSSLSDPIPMPQRIPVSRKYSHIQSKIAQLWQDEQNWEDQQKQQNYKRWQNTNLPVVVVDYEKQNKGSSVKEHLKKEVGEDVVQQAIELHVRSLSRGIFSQTPSDEGEILLDENLMCKDFGIKDFLSASGSDDDDIIDFLGDMGKALETTPPDVLDCHLVEIMANTPPPMDDVRTPTPSSDVDQDGFPDECVQCDLEENQLEKKIFASGDSERSESEVSLNFTNASADSVGDPEQTAAEILETDLLLTQIDNAEKLLRKLSISNIDEQINGEEELDSGDRFDDKAAVASLD